ncbi:hypothetical protein [Janthinobacterium violaceinigrum]|uniref:Uncharacterized protein n=1 Tax=Janthinobacterium violaceinigrum TaxID=2654252 RepID=A0A6I1IFV7_9BURK|nr:hypothetical protein [Janthinobacterium violaceinigrum]KAB8066247.1 hypothetical protein GCN75_03360 [Janthinobacterium violaceinigrum]
MTFNIEEFRTAYKSWKAATERYDEHIEKMIAGAATMDAEMEAIIDDLKVKHAEFMRAGTPVIR